MQEIFSRKFSTQSLKLYGNKDGSKNIHPSSTSKTLQTKKHWVWNGINLVHVTGWVEKEDLRLVIVHITGTRVLHVEASTDAITCTLDRTVFQWRRCRRLVCRIQSTQHRTVLRLPDLTVWYHLNWVKSWCHGNNHLQQHQQQRRQKHCNQRLVHLWFVSDRR